MQRDAKELRGVLAKGKANLASQRRLVQAAKARPQVKIIRFL